MAGLAISAHPRSRSCRSHRRSRLGRHHLEKGDRAGVGWHGGQDNTCPACRTGDFANCESNKITGITYDGGYQQYMVAPIEAVARIPDELEPAEAAPLLCAGITTFNALRHSAAGPGDLVAVQGIGGLGHMGIQFANKFGYRVAAVGRGPENAALAKNLVRTIMLTVVLAVPQSS